MNLRDYIKNISNFNSKIYSEEDLKIKVIIPFLNSLGYADEDMKFENPMSVAIGSKITTVYSDIEIEINGLVELVIDVKRPAHSVSQKDILQASSYAKLISTPPRTYEYSN